MKVEYVIEACNPRNGWYLWFARDVYCYTNKKKALKEFNKIKKSCFWKLRLIKREQIK